MSNFSPLQLCVFLSLISWVCLQLDICTSLTSPTFYFLTPESSPHCNNSNNFWATITPIPHTYCATPFALLALPNFLISTTMAQRGLYCFLNNLLFFPSCNLKGYILKSVKWDEICWCHVLRRKTSRHVVEGGNWNVWASVYSFPPHITLGQGWIKRTYIKIKSMRDGEDFSPIVGQTWVRLTLSQWNSHLSIKQWKQRVCQSFTCVSFNTSDLLNCKWSWAPTKRILKEVFGNYGTDL